MTTPRDDISGLSEDLLHLVSLDRPENGGPYQGYAAKDCVKAMEKAAAKLDSLLEERDALRNEINDWANEVARYKSYAEKFDQENDALQARVKELEAECFRLAADTCHAGYGDEHGHHRCREVDQANARALRAEQELDAMNDNHRVMARQMADLGRALIKAEQERDEAYERAAKVAESPDIWKQYDGDFEGNCIAAAIRRLASGPEKEGK